MVNTKLVVGLGNPGLKYQNTRHNLGFMIVDHLVEVWHLTDPDFKFNGQCWSFKTKNNTRVILAKPLTFMNLSGDFVQKIAHFYQISNEQILVIYDDVDLNCSKVRFRLDGRSGGHNGMRDIINKLGNTKIPRLKVGIGPKNLDTVNFVLGQFTNEEKDKINNLLPKITYFVKQFIDQDTTQTITKNISVPIR